MAQNNECHAFILCTKRLEKLTLERAKAKTDLLILLQKKALKLKQVQMQLTDTGSS